MKRILISCCAAAVLLMSSTCGKKENNAIPDCNVVNLNLFSVSQDKELGAQVAAEIAANPTEYPVIPESEKPQAYAYLRGMRDKLLNSGKVSRKSDFDWPVYIIRDDNTLNAFATPGGYIYVYTGLIKYLDKEDDLAGVLGHEIAHADRRHSSQQLTQQYGIATLIQIATGGNPGLVSQVLSSLLSLKYSRCHESEADAYSVDYLAGTNFYSCTGTASFFQKLVDAGQSGGTPTFLSTHPSPENRVADINNRANTINCNKTSQATDAQYAAFKAMF